LEALQVVVGRQDPPRAAGALWKGKLPILRLELAESALVGHPQAPGQLAHVVTPALQ
jgi:hypothetical protein